MRKFYSFLIAALMLALPMGMWGQTATYSLTPNQASTGSSSTSYITSLTEFSYNSISWKMNQWNPSSLQIKCNQSSPTAEFRFYNTSAIPGRITQVVMTFSDLTLSNTTNTGFMFVGGTSEVTATTGGTAGTWNATAKTITWTPGSSDNFTYFAFYQNGKVATGTNKLATANAIVVTYETSGGSTPTTYTVTYDANGGTGTMTDSNSPYNADATVTVLGNEFTRTGYEFDHWNTAADNSGDSYDEDDTFTINANTTLYAQWTAAQSGGSSNTITITQDQIASFTNSYAWYDWTADGISGKVYAYKNSGMQFNSSKTAYWIYNTTAIPGRITSIKMTKASGTDRSWTLKVGNETLTTTSSGTAMGNSQTVGTSGATWTVTGNYTHFLLYVSGGATTISSIEVTYEASTDPSITANNENITYDATSGSITYTINNEPSPAGTLTAAVTNGNWLTLGQGTTSPIAFTCSANENTTERTATVTLTYTYGDNETVTANVTVTQAAAPVIYSTIPALFAAATSTETPVYVTFSNWVVSGVSLDGKSVFVTDNAGNGFVIYNKDGGLSNTYTAGNILSGTAVSCTLKKFNGFTELINVDAASLTFTTGGTVTAANVALADLAGVNTGALVHYDNLTCSITDNKYYLSDGTTTLQVYNALYAFDALTAGKTYNITGVYQQYNSTKEILPRSADDIEEVTITHEYTLTVTTTANVEIFTFIGDAQQGVEGAMSQQVNNGTEIGISVSVDNGYALVLMVDGTDVTSQLDNSGYYSFYMPTHDVTVSASAVPVTTYTLATSIESGRHYIITNGTDKAMGAQSMSGTSQGNNRTAVGISTVNDVAQVTGSDVYEFVINGPDANGFYTIYDAIFPGYLYAASNGSNHLKTEAHLDGNALWTITFDDENDKYNAIITAQGANSHNTMRYNSSSSIFSCYVPENNQGDIYLFMKDEDTPTYDFYKDIAAYTIGETSGENLSNGWYLIATPVADGSTPSSCGLITDNLGDEATTSTATYDFYKFDATQDMEWCNYRNSTFTMMDNGKGYLYASKEGVTLHFAGAPANSGVVEVAAGVNLIGNPFGCRAYLSNNQSFYKINDARNRIEAIDANTSNITIDMMEGIFVDATTAGTVTFSKTTSAGSSNHGNISMVLAQTVTTRGGSNAETLDNAIVSFNEGSQLEKFYFGTQNANIYIPQNGKDYAIVSAEAQGEMPVSFKANEDGQYTITVNANEVEMNYLHLIDNMTGANIDLLATPSYTFDAKTTDYTSRFRLVFSANEANAENDDFAFFSNGQIILNGDNSNATLQVIDMMGRIVSTQQVNDNAVMAPVADGVYVLRLINGSDIKTQKIVVR